MTNPAADPILIRFRQSVAGLYVNRLDRTVLFGSRARGEAHPDSDYDVAGFLHDMADRWEDMKLPADLSTDHLEDTGEFIHVMLFRAGAYDERTPLKHEIRSDGIVL